MERATRRINRNAMELCFSFVLSAGQCKNLGTYVKQRQCYEVFTIHRDLICEPFNSYLSSAMSQESCNITVR